MDYFRISDTDKKIHGQLYAIRPVGKVWDKYSKNKSFALRLIMFAMNMTEWTVASPFAGTTPEERKKLLQRLYFPDDPEDSDISKNTDIILMTRAFQALAEKKPGQSDLRALAVGQAKMRGYIEQTSLIDAAPDAVTAYSNALSKTGKTAQEILNVQFIFYNKFKEEYEAKGGDDAQLYV